MVKPVIDEAVALVTGASSGIGVELARQLAPRVRELIVVARRGERLEELATELRGRHPSLEVRVETCDLTDRDAIAALGDLAVEREVDLLVNNAGLGDISMFELADWNKTERMLELNVRALAYLTHRLLPGMAASGRGGVLNISSGFGLAFMPGFSAYVGSKHFVTGFTESLHIEMAPLGIAVTQVCPGPVATEFEDVAGNFTGQSVAWVEITAEQCARASLRGFARGRALVIPGVIMKIAMFFQSLTPRWFFRLAYGPGARYLRKKQLEARS